MKIENTHPEREHLRNFLPKNPRQWRRWISPLRPSPACFKFIAFRPCSTSLSFSLTTTPILVNDLAAQHHCSCRSRSRFSIPRFSIFLIPNCFFFLPIQSMASSEDSLPLLPKQPATEVNDEKKPTKPAPLLDPEQNTKKSPPDMAGGAPYGWTADGLPLNHVTAVGEPIAREQWDSSLFACLGRNDEFCSSDLEVCLLGSVAPCVLYGSNVERLASGPGTFANHCLPYTGFYLIGNSIFGSNCLAPWFSYPSRTAIRRKFNLEGSCEALSRSCGCCGSCVEDEVQREQCESACDFGTHVFCHACALCQEGRELRRRLPHPGFNAQPVIVMIPPGGQAMGR